MRVTLSEPGVEGSYAISERRVDGTLVLRPETLDEVIARFADRPLSAEGQEEAFRRTADAAE